MMRGILDTFEESKDIKEAIQIIKKLQVQRQMPIRNGMIDALQEAKNKAPMEITALELAQGDRQWMPFPDFSDTELYRKLAQYQQGLTNYCIGKVGEKVFDELMKK